MTTLGKRYWNARFMVLMLLPALAWYAVFCYAPMYGVLVAFKDLDYTKGIWGSPWVGLENFRLLFTPGQGFGRVLRNTVVISLLRLLFVFPSGIVIAVLLNEVGNGGFKKTVQTISYLPHFISWVVIGGIVIEMLSPSRGAVNQLIQMLGGKPIYFITKKEWFRPILIASDVWQSAGWGSIVFLAAITGIDPQLYESAVIDGAGRWSRMLHITVPSIMNVIVIMLIINVGNILNAGFDQIQNMYNINVYEVADIIDTYVYRIGIVEANYSFAAAVGLFKNLVGVVLVIGTDRLAKQFGQVGLW